MSELAILEEKVDDLENTVYGNGKPGLKADMISIGTDLAWIKKTLGWVAGIMSVVVAGLILAGIVALVKMR